jgi:hypothetical protein
VALLLRGLEEWVSLVGWLLILLVGVVAVGVGSVVWPLLLRGSEECVPPVG